MEDCSISSHVVIHQALRQNTGSPEGDMKKKKTELLGMQGVMLCLGKTTLLTLILRSTILTGIPAPGQL